MLRTNAPLLALALAAAVGCGGSGTPPAPEPTLPTGAPTGPEGAGATAPAAGIPDTDRASMDLIPREVLFGNPERASAQLSPDGTWLSYLAPVDGVLNVWVAPRTDVSDAKAVTSDDGRGIRRYFWTYLPNRLLYLQDKEGNENWQLYSVDVETGDEKLLTPQEEITARVYGLSEKHPGAIFVGLNDRDPRHHDVYRLDLETGETELVETNEAGYVAYVSNHGLELIAAMKQTEDGGIQVFRRGAKGAWQPAFTVPKEDALTTNIVGVDRRGRNLFATDSRGRDTAALVSIDLRSGKKKVLAKNPKADASAVLAHPTKKTIQAVAFEYDRTEWTVLDRSLKKDLAVLREAAEGDLDIVDRTLDDRHWLVLYSRDDASPVYYLYDRKARKAEQLFSVQPELDEQPLVNMHPIVIEARDGKKLVSYLSLPRDSDTNADGTPEKPAPMVLLVHGGPWARDVWGFNPQHQWLANRGYAVLSINFRGSTGFGKGFLNAANMEWAGAMHEDLLDGVKWAVDQGVTTPDQVAIMGGSYGGYATLVGLTFTPDAFACGVDIVGPSNLETLLATIPPYWAPLFETFAVRVGDPRTDEGKALLRERSPLHKADAITKPLLIAQGANDPRVKQAESDQIVAAMQAKDVPVTYVLYPDEGHGFARPENRLSFQAITEAFLSQCLGGTYQPIGDDLAESTAQVVTGDQMIPGLTDAVRGGAAPRDEATPQP